MRARSTLPVIVTAIVTAVLTSLFWIVLYNSAGPSPPAPRPADNATAKAPPPTSAPRAAQQILPSGLIVPVEGISSADLFDSWGQARSEGRTHEALDIPAPKGTRVVAAAAGIVEKIHESVPGGHTVYVRTMDGRYVHYYAHLDAYAPGLAEGRKLRQGDAVGFVGATGNADPSAPHLHFAIQRMAPGEKWYQGTPINPFEVLATRHEL